MCEKNPDNAAPGSAYQGSSRRWKIAWRTQKVFVLKLRVQLRNGFPMLDQSKSKLVWETIASPRANKLRVLNWQVEKVGKPTKRCQRAVTKLNTSVILVVTGANIFGEQTRLPLPGVQFLGAQRETWRRKNKGEKRGAGRRENSYKASFSFISIRRIFVLLPNHWTPGRDYEPSQAHFFNPRLHA